MHWAPAPIQFSARWQGAHNLTLQVSMHSTPCLWFSSVLQKTVHFAHTTNCTQWTKFVSAQSHCMHTCTALLSTAVPLPCTQFTKCTCMHFLGSESLQQTLQNAFSNQHSVAQDLTMNIPCRMEEIGLLLALAAKHSHQWAHGCTIIFTSLKVT